jgi:hypothetical protein
MVLYHDEMGHSGDGWFDNLCVLTGTFMGECLVGQHMGHNGKVIHWPDKPLETAEL